MGQIILVLICPIPTYGEVEPGVLPLNPFSTSGLLMFPKEPVTTIFILYSLCCKVGQHKNDIFSQINFCFNQKQRKITNRMGTILLC